MFERHVAADFVVDDDGTDGVGFQFAADHRGGDAAFFQIAEQVDIEEEPVGQHDEGFDAAVEQHFQIALEAAALVVHVGEDGKIRRLVQRIFDAAQHQRAVGSVMSKTMTPTVWLRLLRRERANWLGR